MAPTRERPLRRLLYGDLRLNPLAFAGQVLSLSRRHVRRAVFPDLEGVGDDSPVALVLGQGPFEVEHARGEQKVLPGYLLHEQVALDVAWRRG